MASSVCLKWCAEGCLLTAEAGGVAYLVCMAICAEWICPDPPAVDVLGNPLVKIKTKKNHHRG